MPEIITGRSHSSRDKLLFDKIRTAAQSSEVVVIVPDQFSFESDRQLYEALGAKLFNSIQTAGIAALSEKISREYGSSGLAPADDNSKLIAMYRAQSKLRRSKSVMTVFAKSLMRPKFVSDCIRLSEQLTRSGADAASLRAASETDGAASLRLRDTAAVIEAYKKEIAAMELRDNVTETVYAAELARDEHIFKGKNVFFYAFTNFSRDQLELVRSIIRDAASVTFSILFDEVTDSADPFRDPARTIEDIRRISEDCNRNVKLTKASGSDQTAPLRHIDCGYFAYDTKKAEHESLVTVAAAADIYEECDYICAKITELVNDSKRGLSLNDIAVICGSLEEDHRILSSAAAKYSIPCFIDMPDSALRSIPGRYLMSILDACSGKTYKTEKVLRLIKSPLSFFHYYDALDIEEYCITWGIEGDMWKNSFERGDGKPFKKRIDETRERIIAPLEKFRSAVKNTTADGICKALYVLLDELEMSKQIYSRLQRVPEGSSADLETVRTFKQVWTGMTDAIKSIYRDMNGQKMSLKEFTELITLMLSSITLSNPPQKNNCLRVGTADHSVMSGVKVLFIMHANEGVFPAEVKSKGLLTDRDLETLSKQKIVLDSSPNVQIDKIRLGLYSAMTLPSEQLIVTYSDFTRTGDPALPSSLPTTLLSIFNGLETLRICDLPLSFFCTDYSTAFAAYLEHCQDGTPELSAVREALMSDNTYRDKLTSVEDAAKVPHDKLSRKTASEIFFRGNEVYLSSTKINTYYNCPFSYYCKYGLKIDVPEKVDVDRRFIGSIVHSCLERVMSREKDGKRIYDTDFITRTDDELLDMISKCVDDYVAENMGGEFGKSIGFRFAIERIKQSARNMAVNFREELKNSGFIPVAFEYSLKDSKDKPVINLPVDDETFIRIAGMIDRVDLYQTDETAWIRIIDYKTGKLKFNLSDIYHGLDLQMLIYMLAVTRYCNDIGKGERLPAGITYSHIKSISPSVTPDRTDLLKSDPAELQKLLRELRAREFKPDGIMTGEVIPALNTSQGGVYTIFKLNTNNEPNQTSVQPVDVEKIIELENFALERVAEMGQRLKKGEISADPIRTFDGSDHDPDKGRLPCTYCDYRPMCRNADPRDPKTSWNKDADTLDELLDKRISEKAGNKTDTE